MKKEGGGAPGGGAPAGPPPSAATQSFTDQTLRLIVRISIGGNRVRIRVSNEMGTAPLRIGAAHIGVRASAAAIESGSDRALTFSGSPSITIPAGAPALSDPVELNAPALSDLAISLYLPGTAQATTIHDMAMQTSYVSLAGDFTGSTTLPVQRTIGSWPFLTEVDVEFAAPVIVTVGDSITDGARSTGNANRRWPDYLARRLQLALGANGRIGVVNRGISANRLLLDLSTALLAGHDVLERFDRDVLATAGVSHLMLLIGINDIVYSPSSSPINVSELIMGYRQVIARARARGIPVFGATIPPFEGLSYFTAARESVRQSANGWIRASGEFDAMIDFDQVLRDPARQTRLLPAYDSGDHLHPNDSGYQAMAEAVPLALFSPISVPDTLTG